MSLRPILSTGLFCLIAVWAFVGTASASTLTSPEGTTYTGEVVATATNSEFHGSYVTVNCGHSELKLNVEQHGAINAGGKITLLTFTGCNYLTRVKNEGTLEISGNGNIIWKETAIEVETSVGTCIFSTPVTGTNVGTLNEGESASWSINSAKIPRTGGNFLCGSSRTWTGSYDFTTPNALWVD